MVHYHQPATYWCNNKYNTSIQIIMKIEQNTIVGNYCIHWKFDERCSFRIWFRKGFAACLIKDEWPGDLTTRYWSKQSPSVGDKSSVSTKSTRTYSENQPLIETKSCDAICHPWTSDLSPDKPQARQRGVWSGKYRPHCRDWKKYHRDKAASRHKNICGKKRRK